MTQSNKTPKKFGINLACNMAADCIRENYAPTSIILSNLLVLQKADTFPKSLSKEYFKRPASNSPSDVQIVRQLMDAMRSPNNGIPQLLIEKLSNDWVFKKAPPAETNNLNKTVQKNKTPYRGQKTTPVSEPKIFVKK